MSTQLNCDAVPMTMTVQDATVVMLQHIGCDTDRCQRRQAAYNRLVDAGRPVAARGRIDGSQVRVLGWGLTIVAADPRVESAA